MFELQHFDSQKTKKGGWIHAAYCKQLGCVVNIFTAASVDKLPAKVDSLRVFGYENGSLRCVLAA